MFALHHAFIIMPATKQTQISVFLTCLWEPLLQQNTVKTNVVCRRMPCSGHSAVDKEL